MPPRRATAAEDAQLRQSKIAGFQRQMAALKEQPKKPKAAAAPADAAEDASFAVGDKVVLARGQDECLDSPGELGIVDAVDPKTFLLCPRGINPPRKTPFRVMAFDGKVKWYGARTLRKYAGETPSKIVLMQAAQRGDLELIGKCVFSGTDINTPDAGGATALHYASRGGQLSSLHQLIKNGATVDALNKKQQTPLCLASSTEIIDALLKAGADPTLKDDAGRTPAEILETPLVRKSANVRMSRGKPPKNHAARSSVPKLPSPWGGSGMSVRASMSGVAASRLSLRPPPGAPPSHGGGSVTRHSWAGDRMPRAAARRHHTPNNLLNIDRRHIGCMELGAFLEQGYAAQEAAVEADRRARLRNSLCKHMEDALFYSECRLIKMASEIEATPEPEPEEPPKFYLRVYKKEEEEGEPPLDKGAVEAAFGKYECLDEVEEIAGPPPDDTENERAKSKRDGTSFQVTLKPKSGSEEDIAQCKMEVKRAIAEQHYVPVYASLPPDEKGPEPEGDDLVLTAPGGGTMGAGKTMQIAGSLTVTAEDPKEPEPILWLMGHSALDQGYAEKMFVAMNEYEKEVLRALADTDDGLDALDDVAEPLMVDASENMAKDDVMMARTGAQFLEKCNEHFPSSIAKKMDGKSKMDVAKILFPGFVAKCEEDDGPLEDEEKEEALKEMMYQKLKIDPPKKVEVIHAGTVACTLDDMDTVLRVKRAFKRLRVPAEDPMMVDDEGEEQPAGRFTVTLDDVAGPLFGLVVQALKPMMKSEHTERDPESIKDEVCDSCRECTEMDPDFDEHKCQEGVCKEHPRADGAKEPVFNCFTKFKCRDKFGGPRKRLGMLCDKCRSCEKCTVQILWDLPEKTAEAIEADLALQALDLKLDSPEGEPVSYLVQVRTGARTSDLGRGITPSTDAGISVLLVGRPSQEEDKLVQTPKLKLEDYPSIVRDALENLEGVDRVAISLEKNGLNEAGTTVVHLDLDGAGIAPEALLAAVEGVGKTRGLSAEVIGKAGETPADRVLPPDLIKIRVDGLSTARWLEAPTITDPSGKGAFEAAMTSTFRIETNVDVGQVVMLNVAQDLTGARLGWFCDEVTVAMEGGGRGDAKFFCRKWLDATRDDLQVMRDLRPFRPPISAALRPAPLSEYIKLQEAISKVEATGERIDALLAEQQAALEKEKAEAEEAGNVAAEKAVADVDEASAAVVAIGEPTTEPEPEPDADEDEDADEEAAPMTPPTQAIKLTPTEKLKQVRLQEQRRQHKETSLQKLRAAADTDMQTLQALKFAADVTVAGVQPDSPAVQPRDENNDDRVTWEEIFGALHRDRRGLKKLADEWENGKQPEEGATEFEGYGLEGWASARDRMKENLKTLLQTLLDSLESDSMIRWFQMMSIDQLTGVIQGDSGVEPPIPPLNGKAMHDLVKQGGFKALAEYGGGAPMSPRGGGGGGDSGGGGARAPAMVPPGTAFEHLLQCSSPDLRKQGRDLRQEWLWEVGCLDGTPIVKLHHNATAEGESEGDAAKLPSAERAKIGHGGNVPTEGAPCQYCAAHGIHSNADSWEVALGGVVGDEMADAGAAGEPKWAGMLQKIRHWFIPPAE